MTGELGDARPPDGYGPEAAAALRAVREVLVREGSGALAGRRTGHGAGEDRGDRGEPGGKKPGGAAGGAVDRLAAACREAGRALAVAGVPLGDALDALAAEWGSFMGDDPGFAAVRSFADAWGDGTLAWLHRLDCTDPLTGLAGPGHLRTRLGEVLRGRASGSSGRPGPALVVADLRPDASAPDALVGSLLVARAGTMVRSVFPGDDTVASLGGARLGVLAESGPWLSRRAVLLERMLATIASPEEPVRQRPRRAARVRVLSLPADADAAHRVLDDVLRRAAETAERA